MTSIAKIEANRLNALKSTGPRSHAGKARSCQNAYQHGMTSKPDPNDVLRHYRELLVEPDARPEDALGDSRKAAALELAMAEAELDKRRQDEVTFLTKRGRRRFGIEDELDLTPQSYARALFVSPSKLVDGIIRGELSLREVDIILADRILMRPRQVAREARTIKLRQRYWNEAEARHDAAREAWIAYQSGSSETKPKQNELTTETKPTQTE